MNKRIVVKTLYRTGDFSNIEFTEEITEIPSHVFLSKKAMELLKKLCIIENEKAFNIYLQLSKITRSSSIKEIIAILQEEGTTNEKLLEVEKLLDELKSNTYDEFLELLEENITKEE